MRELTEPMCIVKSSLMNREQSLGEHPIIGSIAGIKITVTFNPESVLLTVALMLFQVTFARSIEAIP